MIRQLAQCPYCQHCEVALTDNFDLVFNPDAKPSRPCPHLIRVEGRYSQWGLNPLPGRKTKIARMVGSNEFAWQHPDLTAREDVDNCSPTSRIWSAPGPAGSSPPPRSISCGRFRSIRKSRRRMARYPNWEIEGTALFARDAAAFVASLPACLARQSAAWSDLPSPSAGDFDFT